MLRLSATVVGDALVESWMRLRGKSDGGRRRGGIAIAMKNTTNSTWERFAVPTGRRKSLNGSMVPVEESPSAWNSSVSYSALSRRAQPRRRTMKLSDLIIGRCAGKLSTHLQSATTTVSSRTFSSSIIPPAGPDNHGIARRANCRCNEASRAGDRVPTTVMFGCVVMSDWLCSGG